MTNHTREKKRRKHQRQLLLKEVNPIGIQYVPYVAKYASNRRLINGPAVGEKFSKAFSGAGPQFPPTTTRPLHFKKVGGTSTENLMLYTKWDGKMKEFFTRGSLSETYSMHPMS